MFLKITTDLSSTSKKLSKLISSGGYSDDFTPFYSRNLYIAEIETRGPVTSQNLIFAADSFIRQLPEPYAIFLSPDFIKNTAPKEHCFKILNPDEGKKELFQLLSKGSCLSHANFFSMSVEKLELFWNSFYQYFNEPKLLLVAFNLFDIAYGDINFLLFKNGKVAFFTNFTTD